MRIYNYLLFRIYDYYIRVRKEDAGLSLYFTVTASTLIIWFILFIVSAYIDFYCLEFSHIAETNRFSIIISMTIIGLLNYWFFIKDRKFLNYNFKADKKGGYTIVGFLVLLALIFAIIVNKKRDRISNEQEKARIENNQ